MKLIILLTLSILSASCNSQEKRVNTYKETEADQHNWGIEEMNAYYDAGAREADIVQERIKAEQKGKKKGEETKEIEMVLKLDGKGKTEEEISDLLDIPLERIIQIIADYDK